MTSAQNTQGRSLWADAIRKIKKNRIAVVSFWIIIAYIGLAALCAMDLVFTSYSLVDNTIPYQAPSSAHWFGTDLFGRDVLARAAHGTVTSLIVGFVGAGLSVLIGTLLGALAGYFGGLVDELITWFYSTLDNIPYILLLVAFSFVSGPGLKTLCLAIGLTSWVGHCRLVRSEFIKQRGQEYVQGAFSMGASHARRIFVHILPNTLHLILISFSLGFVSAIKSEVILSYLGLGVEPGTPSWGMMISDAKLELSRGVWWGLAAATVFMFFLVLAFTLFNDAVRDATDPKLRDK
ncbi:MAG: peptide ABC transporter permease [Bdellovibrionaceae bacterium]|nr:peptide ABC transporter permease [Pseudobdellovibrionaceae bacterium]|tara:strand:- start:1238 stop:2113 length:876 start_codon:yes stop_codon:yes gene_type:complete